MIKIIKIKDKSPAAKAGLRIGDMLLVINGTEITDCIDITYAGSDNELEFTIERNSKKQLIRATNPKYTDTGIVVEQFKIKRCNNRCLFCFVDQMPKGMRSTLYIKDEDYRLSFLDGSYICATNLSEKDFKRIEEQRLSPLYISVHATNEKMRSKLLNNFTCPPILKIIDRLIASSLQVHTQIVLCPSINDGKVLEKTLDDLIKRAPDVLSIAIVPVGLTQHREKLPELKPLTVNDAQNLIKMVQKIQDKLKKRNILFLADEIYIKAGVSFPSQSHYGDFHQYENGVGMMRDFITSFTAELLSKRQKIKFSKSLVLTGHSAYPYIKKLFSELSQKNSCQYDVMAVDNKLMGERITVTGLLCGKDIMETAKKTAKEYHRIFIPPNCINSDGLTLDGYTLKALSSALKVPVIAPPSLKELL
jgi:putative radical SAM enzyme (TIGR03279 family)